MKPLSWLAALLVPLIPAAVVAAPAQAMPPALPAVLADVQRSASGTSETVNIRVHNESPVTVSSWRVEFELPADTVIKTSWNARFTRTGTHVRIEPEAWNATLAPNGGSVYVGFYAEGTGVPTSCLVNGQPCDGRTGDDTDPTRPAPLTIDLAGGVTLRWAASTDNIGLKYYEVYEGSTLLTTTTATSYVYRTGNTLPPRVYVFRVRAIDLAGNYSASAYASLGTLPIAPPPAPGQLALAPSGPGVQRLTWTQPVPPPVYPAPIIAGYQVSLDGVVVAVTGATRYAGPVPAAGAHVWSVRALDALDRLSAPAVLTQVVP